MSYMAGELRRIADRIERWARFDDVTAPGIDEAETLRRAASYLPEPFSDGRFHGLPYGWIQGKDGIAGVLVILGHEGGDLNPGAACALAKLALRNAEDARDRGV